MARLREIFLKSVETSFSIFEDSVKNGVYHLDTSDGFTDTVSVSDPIRCIFEKFTSKDVELLTFSDLIQPQDVKGLMPFVDIVNCVVNVKGYILFEEERYTVEGTELDPMNVMYTLLLRKV